ncbi:TIR domain-containing protein [Nocardia thailandica]
MADHVAQRQSRVLVVGVASYDDPALPDLASADRAAVELSQGFARSPSESATRVDTVVNPDRREFVQALIEACADTEDQFLLYYAGHGVVSRFGELVLATRDCDPRSPELTGVTWNSVRATLADSPAQSVVVVLDCCFSGATDSALQERRQSAEVMAAGNRARRFTYLVAGRAPWPYQPGVLGTALRAAMEAPFKEGDSSLDLAALATRARGEVAGASQPKLAIPLSAPTTHDHRASPVFISYRHADSNLAALLSHAIADRLGKAAVFGSHTFDANGAKFLRTLATSDIRQAKVVVAVIGPDWESRSNNPDDRVVHEIATAFEHGIPVVPVLVGARGPVHPEEVPERIRQLAYLQFLQVRTDAAGPAAIDAVIGRLLEVL